jgi:hypothetical protein
MSSRCRHCRQPILAFETTEGTGWWHLPTGWPRPRDNQMRRYCPNALTRAEPEAMS